MEGHGGGADHGGLVDDHALGGEDQGEEGLGDGDVGPDVDVEDVFGDFDVDV